MANKSSRRGRGRAGPVPGPGPGLSPRQRIGSGSKGSSSKSSVSITRPRFNATCYVYEGEMQREVVLDAEPGRAEVVVDRSPAAASVVAGDASGKGRDRRRRRRPAEEAGFLAIGGMRIYCDPDADSDHSSGECLDVLKDVDAFMGRQEEVFEHFRSTSWLRSSSASDASDQDTSLSESGSESDGSSGSSIIDEDLFSSKSILEDDVALDYTCNIEGGVTSLLRDWRSCRGAVVDSVLAAEPVTVFRARAEAAAPCRAFYLKDDRGPRQAGKKKKKKEIRKLRIAALRGERATRSGFDLHAINLVVEKVVKDRVGVHSFGPMRERDRKTVRKLASIYGLKSDCPGSGKKRLLIVSRTERTEMPHGAGKDRLGAMLALAKGEIPHQHHSTPARSSHSQVNKEETGTKRSRKVLAGQPLSFVSSGIIHMDVASVGNVGSLPYSKAPQCAAASSTQFAAFECHTRGFGSRMMAKMGFVEGTGLGKLGVGISEPLEAVKRPKSLGLGA